MKGGAKVVPITLDQVSISYRPFMGILILKAEFSDVDILSSNADW